MFSDEVLKREVLCWRDRERRQTAGLMAHLAEIDRRELYAAWGYSSLFAYCEGALGLTEAEAYLRIQVARTAGRCPAILDRLVCGAMTLSVAAVISPVLTVENAGEVLDRASGMTKIEAKELVAGYRPKPRVQSGVRRRPVTCGKGARRKPAALGAKAEQVGLLSGGPVDEVPAGCDQKEEATGLNLGESGVSAGQLEPVERDLYNFRFCADRKLKDRIERLGEVLGVRDPFASLDRILSEAVEVLLDKKDPERREARRVQKAVRKATPVDSRVDEEPSRHSSQNESKPGRSRAIPVAVRDRILARSNYRCEFVHEGQRCEEKAALQVDHVEPFGRGGASCESNLQVLCGPHNRWKAKQDYGRSYIEGKIAAARGEAESDSAETVREHRWEAYRRVMPRPEPDEVWNNALPSGAPSERSSFLEG